MARTRYQTQETAIPLRELPASALRAVLREGYGRADLRADLLAGLVVGVVALPLAMALAIAVGVAPQHGLYTAIIAGFLVALLGGSRTQVSGPTAAFVVILAPIHAKFGLSGLLLATLLGGLILIAMGLLRLGGLIVYIPHPVTTGFTAGIATVIATLQLKDLLGLRLDHVPEHFVDRVGAMIAARATLSWVELGIGLSTLVLLVYLPRRLRAVPAALVVLPAMALVAWLLARFVPGAQVATIASRFRVMIDGELVAGIPQLPPLPLWPWSPGGAADGALEPSYATVRSLIPSAFAIAMLGAIESLLSAVVADGMARTRHDPDAELIALGVGNVVAPFFGGIPATGAIARTATSIRSGARSPIAAMTHAGVVLFAVLLLAPLIGYLSMASLAALLLIVAWNMSEVRHFAHTVRVAPKSDVAVLLTCYVLTVAIDMVIAVGVGVVLAALLFMRRMAEVTHARLAEGESAALPRALPPGVIVYDIAGPLFFGAAQKAMGALGAIASRTRVVVLRMDQVPAMDATGLVALESALDRLQGAQCLTVISGLQPQPAAVLRKSRAGKAEGGRLVLCPDIDSALRIAEETVRANPPPVSARPSGPPSTPGPAGS
jgi:SulP family sulfate permease